MFTIPPKKPGQTGIPGQFSAFYPASSGATALKIEERIREFIQSDLTVKPSRKKSKKAYQADPEKRKRIEETAIKFVWNHFENELGYKITDRQSDNHGYDLLAESETETLCIEVKGRSGSDIVADFSPNEYRAIQRAEKHRFSDGSYRICIVTDTLEAPQIYHFLCWPADGESGIEWWTINGDRQLVLKEVKAARGSVATT